MLKINLGGTCGNSKWRNELIEKLEIEQKLKQKKKISCLEYTKQFRSAFVCQILSYYS